MATPTTPSEAIRAIDDILDVVLGVEPTCGCDSVRLRRMKASSNAATIRRTLQGLVPVEKALDPLDNADFLTIVARISERMRNAAHEFSADDISRAVRVFGNQDWRRLSTSGIRDRIVQAGALLPRPAQVAAAVMPTVRGRVRAVATAARSSALARLGFTGIGALFGRMDRRILTHLSGSQALYITDALTGRNERWSASARAIVEAGLEQGLSSAAISELLQDRLGPASVLGRQANYWDVIATVFSNRSRNFAHLTSMRDASITHYRIESVLDERTTPQCRFLHGHVFEVGQALQRYEDVATADDPQTVVHQMPWVRHRRGELWIPQEDGTEVVLAEVTRNGAGVADDEGEYRNILSDAELAALGVSVPPFHALCRTTIVADL